MKIIFQSLKEELDETTDKERKKIQWLRRRRNAEVSINMNNHYKL